MIVHFIRHLNNASVMDLLLKVISCEETSEGSGILDWYDSVARSIRSHVKHTKKQKAL